MGPADNTNTMTISSIRNRDFHNHDFTTEELAAMRSDGSSSAALNAARTDAGLKGAAVAVRGDDKSNPELREAWENAEIDGVVHGGLRDMAIQGLEGTLIEAAAPLLFGWDALKELSKAKQHGEELAANNERGAMHLAMLATLDLPQGYKSLEIARWKEAGTGNTSGAMKIGTTLETTDQKQAALLQLHADRGMNAARALIHGGIITRNADPAAIARAAVQADPTIKAKLDADPAFRSGFDALVWAFQHDSAAYDAAGSRLDARDARYHQHAIPVQG
jgi:hypothetical protein